MAEFEATLCASVEVYEDGKRTKALVSNKLRKIGIVGNVTGVLKQAETAYSSGAPEFTLVST